MTDNKKKGDLHRTTSQEDEVGGNKKSHAKPDSNSRTAHKQNAGGGSRNVGEDSYRPVDATTRPKLRCRTAANLLLLRRNKGRSLSREMNCHLSVAGNAMRELP